MASKPVVVLDVNVHLSGLLTYSSAPKDCWSLWRSGDLVLGISGPMISKVNEVLYRPYFRTRITDLQRAEWNVLARETSILPDVLPPIAGIAPDAEDDIVLATAVACHADFLVTGDKPFLALGQFQDTRLINPADFIVLMKRFS